jgi:hypothetical protein
VPLLVFRRRSRWRLAGPDPPRPGAVRARVTLPPRPLDHVRSVCPLPIRVERPPHSFIVEPADPLNPTSPACVFVPSRFLRSLSVSAIPGAPATLRPALRKSGLVRPAHPVNPRWPARFIWPAIRLRARMRHVLAVRPGHRPGRGRGLLEPGDQITPRRVLVALSALRVIPVRHVPTDVRIEAWLPR